MVSFIFVLTKIVLGYNITVLYNDVIFRGIEMVDSKQNTLGLIHKAAINEFSEKGFNSASLRNIVKNAGVTTGAFYGYYNSKEELFESLVGNAYSYVLNNYRETLNTFKEIPEEMQPESMGKMSTDYMMSVLLYAYEHLDEFKLLLCCAEGTRFEFMIDEMVEIETQATHDYMQVLERLGHPSPKIDERLEHILITGMFNAFFELIIHKMPLEQAKKYLTELCDFYTAGWSKIMEQ